ALGLPDNTPPPASFPETERGSCRRRQGSLSCRDAGQGAFLVEQAASLLDQSQGRLAACPTKRAERDPDERNRGELHRRRRLSLAVPPLRAVRRRAGPRRLRTWHPEPRRMVRALLSLPRRVGFFRLLPRPSRLGPERTGPRRCAE